MITFLLCSNLRAAETVTLLAGESFPPLMWEDNGVAKGIAVEIGKAILVKAGYNVIVKTCPWKRCQVIAEKEGAFITGFSKNDERLSKFIYTDAIMYDDLVIVTKKGKEFSFDETKNFIGKRIGAQLGVGFGEKNQGLKKGMIIETDSNDVSRVRKIMYGRIDGGFFSLGKAGIVYSAKMAGYSIDNFSILPIIVSKDPNYLATGKNTLNAPEKIKKINAAIKVLTYNGTIAKVMKKTF
jgi:polar amino acid transport system substrate-binding protein